MPNKNRRAGDRAEREVINYLQDKMGNTVIRSAGSLGEYDLVVINKKIVGFVQVKSSSDLRLLVRYCKEAFEKIAYSPSNHHAHMCQVAGWLLRKGLVVLFTIDNTDNTMYTFSINGKTTTFFKGDLQVMGKWNWDEILPEY